MCYEPRLLFFGLPSANTAISINQQLGTGLKKNCPSHLERKEKKIRFLCAPKHPPKTFRPILMQSDWEDRKGRHPIHDLFDGMYLGTFLIVSRIEFGVLFCFCALSGGVRYGE